MDLSRRRFALLVGLLAAGGVSGGVRALATAEADRAEGDRLWAALAEGNLRFVQGTPMARDLSALRAQLASDQQPKVIVLGCSDSRVSPELVFDQSLGDLFVVRTAGNVVDPVGLGSIEYAVKQLHCRMLVVLGHEHCGAVEAALTGDTPPTPNLDALIRRISPSVVALQGDGADQTRLQQAIMGNVRHSARDLVTYSRIVGDAVATGRITIVQALYRLGSGEVTRLA